VVHSEKDNLIPPDDPFRTYEQASGPKQWVCHPEGSHVCNNIIYKYRPLVADLMAQHLRRRPDPTPPGPPFAGAACRPRGASQAAIPVPASGRRLRVSYPALPGTDVLAARSRDVWSSVCSRSFSVRPA
jgi:hypothetical protein